MSYNFDAAVSPFIKALPPSGLAKFLDIMAANPKHRASQRRRTRF